MRRRAKHARAGFTLLEMLMVLVILGILTGVMAFNLLGNLRRTEVRNAAAQVMNDLRLARMNAQKTGLVSPVTIVNGTGGYTAQTNAGAVQIKTLENGVTLWATTSTNGFQVAYRPPFGTLDTIGLVWEVRSRAAQVPSLYIKVVGVTGKVILSESRD